EKMRGRAGVELAGRRRLLCEIRREALVEEDDRDVEHLAQARRELLARARLVAAVAAQRQWQADDDLLDRLVRDELVHAREPALRVGTLHDAERARDRPRRVGHGDARACRPEVERHHLHAPTSSLAAASASATPSGFL